MRKMKKLLCAVLTSAMVLAMAAPSFADTTVTTGTITIDNPVEKQKYVAYKLFDLSLSGDLEGDEADKNFAYTISEDSEWKDEFIKADGTSKVDGLTFTKASTGNVYVVKVDKSIFDEAAAKKLAEDLKKVVANKNTGIELDTTDGSDLPLGYYFVTSTTGTLCSLDTTQPDVEIKEKNEAPTIKKELTNAERDAIAQIGNVLDYTVTIDVKAGVKNYIFHDKMSEGLAFTGTNDVTVTLQRAGQEDEDITNDVLIGTNDHDKCPYKGECAFEVNLSEYNLTANDKVVVAYKARITKDAVKTDSVTNDAKLSYGENNDVYTEDGTGTTVTTKTYKFDLVKTDGSNKVLDNAKFRLYDAPTDGNQIQVVFEDGVYRVADTEAGEEGVDIVAGNVTIKGLDNTSYYLEEIEAPAGYNKLTARKEVKTVEVNAENDAVVENGIYDVTSQKGVQVINESGALLPSTGGIGTTIFYAAGIILMAGAVFFVVRRKRA